MTNESSGEVFSGAPIPAGHDGPIPSGRRAGFVRIEPDGSAYVWRMYPPGSLIDAAKEADARLLEFPPLPGRRWARIIEVDPEADFGRLPAEAREKAGCRLGTFFIEEAGGEWSVRAFAIGTIPLGPAMDAMRRNVRTPGRLHVFGVGRGGVIWDATERMDPAEFGKVRTASGGRVTAGGIILP